MELTKEEKDLTKEQKLLIRGLKIFKMTLEETIAIVLALETREQQIELMQWMTEHREATSSDIIGKTMDIIR